MRAFELVFARHGGPAFSLAYRMCGRRAMAEDIVQESFLSLWRSGARYDPARGSVRSWVLRLVHNRAVDALRRHSARSSRDVADEVTLQQMPAPEHTESEVARREQANLVQGALAGLPAEQRQVIELATSATDALFEVTARGSRTVDIPGSLHGVEQVLVTPEPRGGSLVPTHPPVIVAQLAAAS